MTTYVFDNTVMHYRTHIILSNTVIIEMKGIPHLKQGVIFIIEINQEDTS